ncbi:MFS transporter [Chromobacterium violaceum]|uniref:MFS transporter n=1 Tax=Chromobacterium violaceum TaxID=536 RepID=UPI0009DA0E4D|nr:MFS transporter [Chromobacterium violaceum]OQS20657.1 hypothetical protein B0T41_21675 [Chromobacterium violaceum]
MDLSSEIIHSLLPIFLVTTLGVSALTVGVLEGIADRSAMLGGAAVLVAGLLLGVWLNSYALLLPLWFVLGLGYCLVQTPSGRLLRRSAHAADRPALFAAQFALSHACWLITYPLAGWLGAKAGLLATFIILGVLAGVAALISMRSWAYHDPDQLAHSHDDLPVGHPHLAAHEADQIHEHVFVIDDLHLRWPRG